MHDIDAVVNLTMSDKGRVVVTAPLRRAMGLPEGGKIVARVENGALIIESFERMIERIQAVGRAALGVGSNPVVDLSDERSMDAARDCHHD